MPNHRILREIEEARGREAPSRCHDLVGRLTLLDLAGGSISPSAPYTLCACGIKVRGAHTCPKRKAPRSRKPKARVVPFPKAGAR